MLALFKIWRVGKFCHALAMTGSACVCVYIEGARSGGHLQPSLVLRAVADILRKHGPSP